MNDSEEIRTIPLPPRDWDITAQVTYLCQQLKTQGYPDLVRLLMATEKKERKTTKKGKRVVFVGKEIRGKAHKFYISADLLRDGDETR